jgi:hypothetical protein
VNAARPHPGPGRALELNAADSYASIVRKLGAPAADRSTTQDGVPYRALSYGTRRLTLILRGSDAHYIGAVDSNWNPIHSVPLSSGESSATLLRSLKRF